MALMAEALHTLSDIFVSGFLLIAAFYSRKAPDQVHMFGYGRAQYAAALTAAILVSMAIAAVPLIRLYRQKQRGPAAKAQLTESINDEMGLLAALAGTLLIRLGKPLADPIASIVVATIIAHNGIKLFLENFSFLLGRSPGPEYLARLENLALTVPGVSGVHDLRAEYVGPDIVHAGMHLEVQRGISIEEADHIAHEVENRIHPGTSPRYCVIHVDPADPPAALA